jgi:hypothetical protein
MPPFGDRSGSRRDRLVNDEATVKSIQIRVEGV